MPGKIATPEEYRTARLALLAKEKELLKTSEAIKAERRALPLLPVTKDYTFQSTEGPVTLKDLFGTKSQLIVYHAMFEPTAEEGCQGCAFMLANFPDLRQLAQKDTALAVISRAPIEKITPYKEKNFWTFPWVSSYGTDFNYDFHVTMDKSIVPAEYYFLAEEDEAERGKSSGEQPGLSVFRLENGKVYHTYSSYPRMDLLSPTYAFLDLTPAGRQEGPHGPAEFKTPAQYAEESKTAGK
jgi:predicted dithiol-disulfide oxidoreductase (DUF899 family)